MEDLHPSEAKGDDPLAALAYARAALSEATEALESAAKPFPQDEDFHFYSNFPSFKLPTESIRARLEGLLNLLGASRHLRSQPSEWPNDKEDAYEWLVSFQDDILEKIDCALDEARVTKEEMQRPVDKFSKESDSFVYKLSKRRKIGKKEAEVKGKKKVEDKGRNDVKIAQKEKKPKKRLPVPLYDNTMPRPQDRFEIRVDNSNTPFCHPSPFDDARFSSDASTKSECMPDRRSASLAEDFSLSSGEAIHPLKHKLQNFQLTGRPLEDIKPQKPMSLRETPYTFIDLLPALQSLAVKLQAVTEIAVDLEHHYYRSFHGFVCLMQISTRSEDFIIDTLALRNHIGPCLGEIFGSSSICKVMHGADQDNLWLQRDFGIYICNLFDTGQAARFLNFPKFGLDYLLEHFCGVHTDKSYQLADWRIRPLPSEMLRYAREDTHYLLYVYDMLRTKLIPNGSDVALVDPYIEVSKRSHAICWHLYEKELFTEASYLELYRSSAKKLQPAQLAVFAALYSWRDYIARKEDESTSYVLPNRLLFQLADEMPVSMLKLHAIIKGTHSLVEKYAAIVLDIIRQAREQTSDSRVPYNRLRNEDEMSPGMSKEEASGNRSCKGTMQPSPQHLMEKGSETASVVQGSVLCRNMNKVDGKPSETMQGESLSPLKVGSGPALVHRATSSTLFNRKTGTGGSFVGSSFPQYPSTTSVQSQQHHTSSGASSPLSENLELRYPMPTWVPSLTNISQLNGESSIDAPLPQMIAPDPLLFPGYLKKHPKPLSSFNLSSGSGVDEAGFCATSAIETSRGLQGGSHGLTNTDIYSGRALSSAVTEKRIPDKQVDLPMSRSSSKLSAHLGQMFGGFGRRPQYKNSAREEKEEREAKLKVEQIKASVALPFHRFSGPIEGPTDTKVRKVIQHAVDICGAGSFETLLPQIENTLESSKGAEQEETLEEFISLEIKETNTLEEGQPQPDADSGTPPTISSLAEPSHSSSTERMKHRAWWPPLKVESYIS